MADEIDSASTAEMRSAADELKRTMKELESLSGSFATGLTSGLKSAVSEGKKLDAIFRDLGRSMSSRLLDMALQPLRQSLTKGVSTLFSGAVPSGSPSGSGLTLPFLGNLWPFARGGIVSSPVAFPLSGGDLGLAGEAGTEAIMPLARGPDGRLGVRGAGNGGMNVTFNVTTPDADSFRKSEAHVTTMLARAVGRGRRGL